jgi:L-lactate dehydrogenase complex protein LldG
MDSGAIVMERIREAAARAAAGPLSDARKRPAFPRIAAQSPFAPGAAREECVERFRAELEALASWVYGPLDAEGAAEAVLRLVRERGASSVLAWDEAEIGCPAVARALEAAGIRLVSGAVPNTEEHQTTLERLAGIEVGLTGALAGLADTGSIIVASGPGRPRNASLLPLFHIAVLPVSRIHPTMHDWLAAGGVELTAESANLVVITGGSRTSDIELQLTLGMHGPRELHVVLYRDGD